MVNQSFWSGKKVFVTGHTGFKGAWLSSWLLHLGCQVHGFSLAPNTHPSLFEQLALETHLHHQLGDIRDQPKLKDSLSQSQPDIVFHLAAQPLVRRSYIEAVETWNTNVLGTIHLLEAIKSLTAPCAVGDFERTIAETVTWYREARLMSSSELPAFTLGQIKTSQNFDSC
jgi:CDP-glucose 4,6-dehydratase